MATAERPTPAPRPRPHPQPRPRPQTQQTLLVVPQVPNDSTTLLQKSPTSAQEDEETFFSAVISPTASMCVGGGKEVEALKGLTLITLDSERKEIAKTAALSAGEGRNVEDGEEKEEEEVCDEKARILAEQEDKSYSEWVKIFVFLRCGYCCNCCCYILRNEKKKKITGLRPANFNTPFFLPLMC